MHIYGNFRFWDIFPFQYRMILEQDHNSRINNRANIISGCIYVQLKLTRAIMILENLISTIFRLLKVD